MTDYSIHKLKTMRVQKIAALIVLVSMGLFSCKKDSIRGEGRIIQEDRTVSAFQKVEFSGEGSVVVLYGATQAVKIEGYENLVPVFESNVNNGTLVLKYKSDYYNVRNSNIKVTITTPDIKRIYLNGSGTIRTGQNFAGSDLSVEVNGSGKVFSENASFTNLNVKINGSGNADVEELVSDHADVTINGSGDVRILALKSLKARIFGSGNVYYSGNPFTVDTEVSGSGKIVKN